MMKTIGLAVAALCISIGVAQAAAAEPALAPFAQFTDAMNAGDVKKAADAYAPSPSIIDEFGPHYWTSFADWVRDFGTFAKAESVSDFHIALSPVSFKNVDARHGYAVVPSTLTYKVKGKPTTEKGMFTFSTAKTASGWRITGWAWSTL